MLAARSPSPKLPRPQHLQQLPPGRRQKPPHLPRPRPVPPGLSFLDVSEFDEGWHGRGVGREPEPARVKGDGAQGFQGAGADGWGHAGRLRGIGGGGYGAVPSS